MSMTATDMARVFRQADCLHERDVVEARIEEMATEISADMMHGDVVVICVMNGGLVFAGSLLPRLALPLRVDYLHATRYRERTAGDALHWKATPTQSLAGRDLLVVDDILDEGYTLEGILKHCAAQKPASLRAAVLVQKRHDRGVRPQVDYVGLEVPDRYVFGYGMDYKGFWRNAPGIYAIAD